MGDVNEVVPVALGVSSDFAQHVDVTRDFVDFAGGDEFGFEGWLHAVLQVLGIEEISNVIRWC